MVIWQLFCRRIAVRAFRLKLKRKRNLGCSCFPEFLLNYSELQILWSLCSVVFQTLTLKLPIQTSLSVAPKLPVSGEKCEHFRKTSTPLRYTFFLYFVAYADFSFLVTIDPIHIFPVDEEPVVFNYVVRHSDTYDNTTGIFTAPLDGDYEFMLHALCNNDTTIDIYIVVDGVMVSLRRIHQLKILDLRF